MDDWFSGLMVMPHNSRKWITHQRDQQRHNRKFRRWSRNRWAHGKTPCQRVKRFERLHYPLKAPQSWIEYCKESTTK